MNRIPYHERYKVFLPEGENGNWSITKFTVGAKDASFDSLRASFQGGRCVPEGTYTQLLHNGSLWMSDTPDEIRDHLAPIQQAERVGGNVLINGLGLGMVATAILKMKSVTHVTVVEMSPEVIALVGPTLLAEFGSKLTIVEADAYKFNPAKGVRYSVVWHDLWKDLCTDNLKEMSTLHRKYGRRSDWQGSWAKALLRHHRRQEQRSGW